MAHEYKLKYRLRYRRPREPPLDSRLPISGYGVELALKKTDYIVIDDRQPSFEEANQATLNSDDTLAVDEDVADLRPLSKSELSSIGVKAASFIKQSDRPFDALVKLTQDFPRFSSSIARHNVSKEFAAEYEENRTNMVRSGVSHLWMNGARLIDRQIEPFALVEMLRRERKLINGVRELGFTGKQAVSLLGHSAIASAKEDDQALRYDWTDRLENGRVIIWLNDLENDERYESYPTDISSLLQRTYPGQIPPIRRNIFNIIVPIDFSNLEDVKFLSDVRTLTKRGIPIRFGLVPVQQEAAESRRLHVIYHIAENYGTEAIFDCAQLVQSTDGAATEDSLLSEVVKHHDLQEDGKSMDLLTISNDGPLAEQVGLSVQWAQRLQLHGGARQLLVNGASVARDDSWMQAISMKIAEDLQIVQKGVFHGAIDDDTWIPSVFLEGASSRRNAYISSDNDKSLRVLDVAKIYGDYSDLFSSLPVIEPYEDSTKESWAAVTVFTDMTSEIGLNLVLCALEFRRNNPAVRLDFIDTQDNIISSSRVNAALKERISEFQATDNIENLRKLVGHGEDIVAGDTYSETRPRFFVDAKLAPGTNGVILNGRVVGPFTSSGSFIAEDFQQLLEFEQARRILPVYQALDDLGLAALITSPIAAAKITSITALSTISDLPEGIFDSAPPVRSTLYESWSTEHTAIHIGDPEAANVHIAGLLDPASEKGQKWAPILKMLSELDGVYIKLLLNPKDKVEELPVKRFYRFVIDSKPMFDESGKTVSPYAVFGSLPSEALLTAGMDVPPAWLVAPKASVHDLDNIKLAAMKTDVEADYELQHILIEGHSREGKGGPPRGVQLVLGTHKEPFITDTIVMANLGFFQFKANPGFYNIKLKEGKSSEVFTIGSIGAQGWSPVPGDEGTELTLMDFQGATVYPRLERLPGHENADVLEETEGVNEDNIMAKGLKFAEGLFSKPRPSSAVKTGHADINIFSVASGHLYERMLNIMMVSVMRNTKHTVKFWFIEQFLSPSFKEFIPHLASEYGFEYEMVTYKWPHWLRQQTEKQREIWGYKILFLDVLFPLSLEKVIFVDADQIVRTDMIDLVNLDLEGAPYGFTPMCDSRTEMEGFRFWKQGYWSNYLRGKPYHISALYVVDLRRFRELAAGDRLRQQYHALSADPNSLSNLDQDLPNHMQFQIPIHSLPQEWLWCETWCSDESLADARTIDLCNNPQTKEPKLERARRQVPEWTLYDEEIAALDARVKGRVPSESKKAPVPMESVQSDGTGKPVRDEL